MLPERPAFFVLGGPARRRQDHGRQHDLARSSWYPCRCRRLVANDEERRKSLLAYLGEGVPLICWDNMPRGTSISCPSIEKALTAAIYQDRVLGVTEFRSVPATSVHLFTGNNIATSRATWHRARCWSALPSIGRTRRTGIPTTPTRSAGPRRTADASCKRSIRSCSAIPGSRPSRAKPAETRFKLWWHLVGAAIEHAAQQHAEHVDRLAMDADKDCKPEAVSFRDIFLEAEAEEEQTTSLNTVLDVLRTKWPGGVKALTVATYAGRSRRRRH